MPLNLIYARARNGVIGRAGALPWHLPEDLAFFKRTTLGAPVLMGRKTWESLPQRFRPLPGRINVVVTRQHGYNAPGAAVAHSLPAATALFPPEAVIWVIGGAELYAQALPLAQLVVVTEIDADFEGDAFAPSLDAVWQETARQHLISSQGLALSFVTYQRVLS